MTTVNAILIDSENKTIKEVVLVGNFLKETYTHLKCRVIDFANIDDSNDLIFDDEGLYVKEDFFRWDGGAFFAGNGLVVGFNPSDGASISTTMEVDKIKEKIQFYHKSELIMI